MLRAPDHHTTDSGIHTKTKDPGNRPDFTLTNDQSQKIHSAWEADNKCSIFISLFTIQSTQNLTVKTVIYENLLVKTGSGIQLEACLSML